MSSLSNPTVSQPEARKNIAPDAPSFSLSEATASKTSKHSKEEDLSNLTPTEENPSSAPSTAPQSTSKKSTTASFSTEDGEAPTHLWSSQSDSDYDSDLSSENEDMNDLETHPVTQHAPTPGLMKTLSYVQAFLDTTKDKHKIELPAVRLRDHTNFHEWQLNVELRLRMHQVWFLFRGLQEREKVTPVPEDHELYVWYERMVDVATSIIYSSVSAEVRKQPCFLASMWRRDLEEMMVHLIRHYDDCLNEDEDEDEDEDENLD